MVFWIRNNDQSTGSIQLNGSGLTNFTMERHPYWPNKRPEISLRNETCPYGTIPECIDHNAELNVLQFVGFSNAMGRTWHRWHGWMTMTRQKWQERDIWKRMFWKCSADCLQMGTVVKDEWVNPIAPLCLERKSAVRWFRRNELVFCLFERWKCSQTWYSFTTLERIYSFTSLNNCDSRQCGHKSSL